MGCHSYHYFTGFILGSLGIILPILLFTSLIVANSTEAAMRKHMGPATDIFRLLLVRAGTGDGNESTNAISNNGRKWNASGSGCKAR